MSKIEPSLRKLLPKDLRDLPEAAAHEIYIYRAVSRGPARVFYQEFEDRARKSEGTEHVEFRFVDVVMYFAHIAGEGILGHLAYDAVRRAVNAIRKPKKELGSSSVSFEAVISKKTYRKLQKERHPDKRAARRTSPVFLKKKLKRSIGSWSHSREPGERSPLPEERNRMCQNRHKCVLFTTFSELTVGVKFSAAEGC
jgi:hypothetical protein